jgi:hypothetical protein
MLDDTYRCRFTFADGRQCKQPICADEMGLCYYHQTKYDERKNKLVAGERISRYLNIDVLTATDLNSALSALFSATAKGNIKPKTAATLAYLGQIMLQTQALAKQEYLDSYEAEWFEIVQNSQTLNPERKPLTAAAEQPSADTSQSTDAATNPDSDAPANSDATSVSDDEEPVSPEQALAAKVM